MMLKDLKLVNLMPLSFEISKGLTLMLFRSEFSSYDLKCKDNDYTCLFHMFNISRASRKMFLEMVTITSPLSQQMQIHMSRNM